MIRVFLPLLAACLCLQCLSSGAEAPQDTINPSNDKDSTMKIYYVADPLCGWCYGFTPVMQQFAAQHENAYTIELVSGGMVTGEAVGPMDDGKRQFISQAYKRVEATTGIRFGEAYVNGTLQRTSVIQTSLTPSVALEVLREHAPGRALDIFHDIQRLLFFEGREPAEASSYLPLSARYEIDTAVLLEKMADPAYTLRAEKQFDFAASLGVRGFPALIADTPAGFKVVASGYTPYDTLVARTSTLR